MARPFFNLGGRVRGDVVDRLVALGEWFERGWTD